MMKKDARIQLVEGKNGNTLVISLAEVEDEGEYQCQLSANQLMEIRHNVRIRGKITRLSLKLRMNNED